MLKLHKNTCQFGRIRPLQLFAPKAKALPKIKKINNNNNSIYDSPLKYKKRQQIRHDSNSKIFRTVDDKTGKESIEDNNNNNLKDQQKLRFFYTPSKTVINQDFSFATNTPGLACAFAEFYKYSEKIVERLPIPIYNTPRKKCIPHSPLCGITFTCVMDVHAINEQGIEIENWWTLQVENETNN
ncbi:hypothetical protein Mgra_00005725 [Meloidogyne graminicola]|uniref:Uncharacterized protein n=1 Tax=Meloidogyne graminicola TaxID=189291 RepID=A0A8S9ZNP1_9BILA|nr:hypothetical protein Mgra_00005725 [Meloidogyne graminicola]